MITRHHQTIRPYLAAVTDLLARLPHRAIDAAVELLLDAYRAERFVYIAGNGGSAATASHFTNDLAKATIVAGQPRFRVIALTDNVSLLTAWANDGSYADAFAEQLRPLIRAGDVFIAISGSGNSENILRAVAVARENGAAVLGLTGFDGGRLRERCDCCIHVPSDNMAQVEDAHLIIQHAICHYLRDVIAQHQDAAFTYPERFG